MTDEQKRQAYADYRRQWTAGYRRLYGLPPPKPVRGPVNPMRGHR